MSPVRRLPAVLFTILALAPAAVACGGGRNRSGIDGGAVDGGSGRSDGGGARDGGGSPDDDGGGADLDGGPGPGVDAAPPPRDGGGAVDAGAADAGPPPIAMCQMACAVAADCDSASPAFDSDNYRCSAGVCRYIGCVDDAECAATFGTTWVCRDAGGLRTCQSRCTTATDCGSATPAFDADNYACTSGLCHYTGCRDDAECMSTFASTAYVCAEAAPPDTGLPVPTADRNCVLGCTTAVDCTTGTPAFDTDNYRCVRGACRYDGCNDDAECRATFMSTGYVCAGPP